MSPPPAELFASRIFLGPALRAQPDRRLVDLVRDGYDAAFEEIVRRYRRPLDRFAAAIVGGRSEDVTQDAFSKALLALRGSEVEIELRPWLYRIVRNTALNDLRDRPPSTEELSEMLPGGRSAAAEAEAREEMRDLMDRLGALPEPQRAALVMRELEGLSHEEIATALGVSGGAARQAIYRARAALREGFGLLLPLPALRLLAEYGGDASRAGGAIAASAGASSAGGAALGGLGGALKVGMATVLVAGAVGAGVAVEHHRGDKPGPEAAEAAPLVNGKHPGAGVSGASTRQSSSGGGSDQTHGTSGDGHHDSSDHNSGNGTPDGGSHSGPGASGGSETSGDSHSGDSHSGGSTNSGEGSHHSGSGGPGPSSGSGDSGSGSGDRHGGSSGSDDSSGSNSGSGSSDGGGTSGGSGSDDGLISGDGGSPGSDGGSDGGEPPSEPILSESSDDGGGDLTSGSDGSSDSTSGSSTGSSGSGSSGSDGSP
jgi:RNA polymerase sigma factor (sigma-70 family)